MVCRTCWIGGNEIDALESDLDCGGLFASTEDGEEEDSAVVASAVGDTASSCCCWSSTFIFCSIRPTGDQFGQIK